jgi:hypothetical protein
MIEIISKGDVGCQTEIFRVARRYRQSVFYSITAHHIQRCQGYMSLEGGPRIFVFNLEPTSSATPSQRVKHILFTNHFSVWCRQREIRGMGDLRRSVSRHAAAMWHPTTLANEEHHKVRSRSTRSSKSKVWGLSFGPLKK